LSSNVTKKTGAIMTDHDTLVLQYESAPGEGLRRFWISWTSWLEDWPETPFFFWETVTLSDGRLRPSMKDDPRAANLPERANMLTDALILEIGSHLVEGEADDDDGNDDEDGNDDDENDLFDTFYVSGGTVCALIDATDEDAAWQLVGTYFPDFEKRFCEERPLGTLSGNASGGRFRHPEVKPKTRAVFMANHGFIVCAFPDHYGPNKDIVRSFEGGGRFLDRPRSDFRQMTIAHSRQYHEMVKFLAEEFQIDVLPVDSVAELIATKDERAQ
jgi:hypothetical protein